MQATIFFPHQSQSFLHLSIDSLIPAHWVAYSTRKKLQDPLPI